MNHWMIAAVFIVNIQGAIAQNWALDGTSRIYTSIQGEPPSAESEGSRLFLAIEDRSRIVITGTITRTLHERIFTNKVETVGKAGDIDYVPDRMHFRESEKATLDIGSSSYQFTYRNESQLIYKGESTQRLLESLSKGSKAKLKYSRATIPNPKTASFSLMGFTKAHGKIKSSVARSTTIAKDPLKTIALAIKGNKFGVTPEELISSKNELGEGLFIYSPRTRIIFPDGTSVARTFIWFTNAGNVVWLTGSTKITSPDLPGPLDLPLNFWDGTGLTPTSITKQGLKVLRDHEK